MSAEDIQIYLDDLAEHTPDEFKDLIKGIADHFYQFRTLSAKQRKAVHVTSSKLGKQTPRELPDFAAEETPRELLSTLVETALPGRNMLGQHNPLADMLREIAVICNKYAEKLK